MRLPPLQVLQTAEPKNPVTVARDLVAAYLTDDDGRHILVRWQECWWGWDPDTGRWDEMSDELVDGVLQDCLEVAVCPNQQQLVPWMPTPPKIKHVRESLQQIVRVPDGFGREGWLDGQMHRATVDCRGNRLEQNGEDEWVTYPASPERFNTSVLAVPYVPAAVPEVWLDFLRETFDPEGILLAQEWAGYLISGSTYASKWIQIVGPPRAGKTLFVNVLAALMDHAGVATSLESLAGTFGLQSMVTAPYAIIDDARLKGNAAIERLLSITGGGMVEVSRKHKASLSMRLPTRIMMCSNSPVQIDDVTGALAARSLFLRAPWSKVGRENWFLVHSLTSTAVLQGILVWALDGLKRLEENGWQFTQPASSAEDREMSATMGSRLSEFLAEQCYRTADPNHSLPLREFHEAYMRWRFAANIRTPWTQAQTQAELQAANYRVGKIGPAHARGLPMVRGWALNVAEAPV